MQPRSKARSNQQKQSKTPGQASRQRSGGGGVKSLKSPARQTTPSRSAPKAKAAASAPARSKKKSSPGRSSSGKK